MTEAEARAALAAFHGLGGLERWIAAQCFPPGGGVMCRRGVRGATASMSASHSRSRSPLAVSISTKRPHRTVASAAMA